jgi:hypothetical protein
MTAKKKTVKKPATKATTKAGASQATQRHRRRREGVG